MTLDPNLTFSAFEFTQPVIISIHDVDDTGILADHDDCHPTIGRSKAQSQSEVMWLMIDLIHAFPPHMNV